MKGLFTMSHKEINRLAVMEQLVKKGLKQKQAAKILELSTRQIIRLKKKYRKEGAKGLIHQNRGRKSNHKIPSGEISRAIRIVVKRYWDFGPTLAWEKLTQDHQIYFSVETLRKTMIEVNLWQVKKRHCPEIFQMRKRRNQKGELVQIDGSSHAWFEDRGSECCLLVFIDDATGELAQLLLVKVESTDAYFQATETYLKTYGKPLAFYSDKHSIFRVNVSKDGSSAVADSNGLTQFGQAMRELGIELIPASTAQAKGRVERANQTLQDRLVKELRLREINTIKKANQYLPQFREEFNRKFAVRPKDSQDAHRPLLPTENLREIMVKKYPRRLSKNLELQYQNKTYQVKTKRPAYALRNAPVTVVQNYSGKVRIYYKNQELKYQILAKNYQQEAVDAKRLNFKLDNIKQIADAAKKEPGSNYKPAPDHPWRQYKQRYAYAD